ncbi:MAG TPA: right-handed parallel beta-helix repeat-containing protein [Vicinamibacteria bacterium]
MSTATAWVVGLMGLAAAGLLAAAAPAAAAPPPVRVDDHGAVGDGIADDSAAIQAALNAVAPGGAVLFSAGKTYRIGNVRAGLAPRSDTRLLLHGATLTMANEDGQRCRIFTVAGRSGVTFSGGTLRGSRVGAPEWAIGILVSDSSDVVVEDVAFRDFATDGVTVTGNTGSQRVRLRRCRAAGMGRNGVSLVAGSDITVEDSLFEDTWNADANMPRAGLSAEPNVGGQVHGVLVTRCHFRRNQGSGLLLQLGGGAALSHLTVTENVAEDDGLGGLVLAAVSQALVAGNRVRGHTSRQGYAIGVTRRSAGVVVRGNVLEGNYRGIYAEGAQVVTIHGNTIVGTGAGGALGAGDDGDGINLRGYTAIVDGQPQEVFTAQAVVSGNSIRGAAGRGILVSQVRQASIANNIVVESGQHGIQARFGASDTQLQGNVVVGSGREWAGAYQDVFVAQGSTRLLVAQNQHRDGAEVRAGIALDNSSDTIVTHNSFLGGPAVPLLQSDNALRTAYNWRGSGIGWNRAAAGGGVQFVPPVVPMAVMSVPPAVNSQQTGSSLRQGVSSPASLPPVCRLSTVDCQAAGESVWDPAALWRWLVELELDDVFRCALVRALRLDPLLCGKSVP